MKTIILFQIFAVNEVNDIKDNNKIIEKFIKSKTRKFLKSQKLSKFQNLSKNKKSPKFDAKKAKLNFLISNVRKAFNYLWLTFIKSYIFLKF